MNYQPDQPARVAHERLRAAIHAFDHARQCAFTQRVKDGRNWYEGAGGLRCFAEAVKLR